MPKELLFSITKKDFDISYFSGKGAGGQHRNRHKNCVRMKHRESGAYATGQSNRELRQNLKEAFNSIINSAIFKMWYAKKISEIRNKKTIEQEVDEEMERIRVEYMVENKWTDEKLLDNIT